MYFNVCCPNPAIEAKTQNVSKLRLITPLPCLLWHISMSTCVDQTFLMLMRKWIFSQQVLKKPVPRQRGKKVYFIMYLPNTFHASLTQNAFEHVLAKQIPWQRGKKWISTWVYQTPSMITRTQNFVRLCKPNPPMLTRIQHASTRLDKTPIILARKQYVPEQDMS